MTLRLYKQTRPAGGWTQITIGDESFPVFEPKLIVSYSQPASLNFMVLAPEHEFAFNRGDRIIFYDDASYTFNNPNFEGYVAEISPSKNNQIEITCYDNTKRMTEEIVIMSQPWDMGNVSDDLSPAPGTGAVPRLVFNVPNDRDDDFAFMRTEGVTQEFGSIDSPPVFVLKKYYTIGEMIQEILDDAYAPMHWINAANDDGTSYTVAELSQLFYQPQEKQVFETESVRSGLDRLLTQHPAVRYLWVPGPDNRRFKLIDARQSPATTLTLNDFTGSNPVLAMQLRRVTDHVRTAVKVYGPETTTLSTISTSSLISPSENDGALKGFDGVVLETYSDGTGSLPRNAVAYRKYQVKDPDKRRSSNQLNQDYNAGAGAYNFFRTRSPTVEVSFDNGNSWMAVWGWYWDSVNGIVDFGDNYIYFWRSESPPGTTQNFFPPTHVRLTYAYYSDPITVRYPTTGFGGTGFDVAGIENTHRFYDEMLAVGYQYGQPVTTAYRVGQFKELCRRLYEQERDISYVGSATLEGIDYRWARLNKRVNLASVDEDGGTITTGWESIGAIVTEVEYDYEQDMTTISFSHDLADYLGWSIDSLKERLKIDAGLYQQYSRYVGDIDFRSTPTVATFFFGPNGSEKGIKGDF